MTKFFKKFMKQNAAELRKELSRAHLIISLLAISVIALLSLGAVQYVTFDPTLSAICVVLLSIIAFISLCMTFTLSKNKK